MSVWKTKGYEVKKLNLQNKEKIYTKFVSIFKENL